jgi:hypothetical protein
MDEGALVTWQTQNTILRTEPTWGDIDVLLDIIQALAPANAAEGVLNFV